MARNRRRTSQSADCEIHLPESIIQHIQSYLGAKQSAQTCLVSKFWHSAWSTRPNLDFDIRDFEKRDKLRPGTLLLNEFSNFANRAMERYQDLNLKIESLRIHLDIDGNNAACIANWLIKKGLEMGANDLDLRIINSFSLPHEVLGAEGLIRLSVYGCIIPKLAEETKVLCSRLRCLTLDHIGVGADTLQDMVLSCPLIEKLVVSNCRYLFEVNGVRMQSNKRLSFGIEREKRSVGWVVDGPIGVPVFCKLNYMVLEGVNLDSSFFSNISVKFPCLEELTLRYCYYKKVIRIASRSLKRIGFVESRMIRAKFDVPSICKFTYCGSKIPSISFTTSPSGRWESDISLTTLLGPHLRASWFIQLKGFLSKLSTSKISLRLLSSFMEGLMEEGINYVKGVEGLPKTVVENLMLSINSSSARCPVLLDGLFLSFCPKILYLTWSPIGILEKGNNQLLRTFMDLVELLGRSFCIPKQNVRYLSDLTEVNLECFDEIATEWQAMPLKAWLDAPQGREHRKTVRFHVKLRTT